MNEGLFFLKRVLFEAHNDEYHRNASKSAIETFSHIHFVPIGRRSWAHGDNYREKQREEIGSLHVCSEANTI